MEKYYRGCISDTKDERDKLYSNEVDCAGASSETTKVDLRDEFMPGIYHQKKMGSCASNATLRAYEYMRNKWRFEKFGTLNTFAEQKSDCTFSRRYLYYLARKLLYMENRDDGSSIRNNCKSLKKFGVCKESGFPYSENYLEHPNFDNMYQANRYRIRGYYRIRTLDEIIHALSNGRPVIISTNVDSFIDAGKDGYSKKALTWNKKQGHNHAMVIVGYEKNHKYLNENHDIFVIANSWGEKWGDNGYCYVPVDQMIRYNLSDMWVLIEDQLSLTLDNESDSTKFKNIEDVIPNSTTIYKHMAYSQRFFEKLYRQDRMRYYEITKEMKVDLDNVIIKNAKGEIKYISDHDKEVKLKAPIKYYNENGQIIFFE